MARCVKTVTYTEDLSADELLGGLDLAAEPRSEGRAATSGQCASVVILDNVKLQSDTFVTRFGHYQVLK